MLRTGGFYPVSRAEHRSLAEAGRVLYNHSRTQKASANDTHRLKQYLQKFDSEFQAIVKNMSPVSIMVGTADCMAAPSFENFFSKEFLLLFREVNFLRAYRFYLHRIYVPARNKD